jgi:hypothetical protein
MRIAIKLLPNWILLYKEVNMLKLTGVAVP